MLTVVAPQPQADTKRAQALSWEDLRHGVTFLPLGPLRELLHLSAPYSMLAPAPSKTPACGPPHLWTHALSPSTLLLFHFSFIARGPHGAARPWWVTSRQRGSFRGTGRATLGPPNWGHPHWGRPHWGHPTGANQTGAAQLGPPTLGPPNWSHPHWG